MLSPRYRPRALSLVCGRCGKIGGYVYVYVCACVIVYVYAQYMVISWGRGCMCQWPVSAMCECHMMEIFRIGRGHTAAASGFRLLRKQVRGQGDIWEKQRGVRLACVSACLRASASSSEAS